MMAGTTGRLYREITPHVLGRLVGRLPLIPFTKKEVEANILGGFRGGEGRAVRCLGNLGSGVCRVFRRLRLNRGVIRGVLREPCADGSAKVTFGSKACATRFTLATLCQSCDRGAADYLKRMQDRLGLGVLPVNSIFVLDNFVEPAIWAATSRLESRPAWLRGRRKNSRTSSCHPRMRLISKSRFPIFRFSY